MKSTNINPPGQTPPGGGVIDLTAPVKTERKPPQGASTPRGRRDIGRHAPEHNRNERPAVPIEHSSFIGYECLWSSVTLSRLELLDHFEIGAQSKTKAEPALQPEAEWVEGLQAQARSVGAAVYEKSNLDVRLKEMPTSDVTRLGPSELGASHPATVREQDRSARKNGRGGAAGVTQAAPRA